MRDSPAERTAVSRLLGPRSRDARKDVVRPDLLRQRADMLVDHDATRIDQERLRSAVDSPVDRHAPGSVHGDGLIRVAELREPGARVTLVVFPVETDQRDHAGALYLQESLVLGAALPAPRTPDVEEVPAALEVGGANLMGRLGQLRERELRCRFTEQRRGDDALLGRVSDADGEHYCEQRKHCERHEVAVHVPRSSAAASSAGAATFTARYRRSV